MSSTPWRVLLRCWQYLDQPAASRAAAWLIPILFGLLSVAYGQDFNWDLQNYHLYNPYALLNGKVGFDLAPGQWQSYFNPTIDLPYYGLVRHTPPVVSCFVMGALHGLNFVLLQALCARLLAPRADGAPAYRGALLLALAGCLGPAFVSGIGNTMGDNLTALTVLGALLLLLRHWPALCGGGARALWPAVLAGLVIGFGTGLKLTNACYALALCLALAALPVGWLPRLRTMVLFGCGVLAGIGVSAGHWYWRMWQVFGNPLFPQFNNLFQAPLAAPIGVGDTGWLPKGWVEQLLWPFLFTYAPQRVSELPLRHLLWPMLYVALLALVVLGLAAVMRRRPAGARWTPQSRMLLLFFSLGYLIWMQLFSIYRYLAPLELLAPLVFWLVMARLMPGAAGRRLVVLLLVLAAASVLSVGNWGRAGRAAQAFQVQTPAIAQPEQSMVFTVHGDPPMGWLVPFFPARLAFVALGSGFPESDAFRARVAAMLAARGGPVWVMLEADRRDPAQRFSAQQRQQAEARLRQVLADAAEKLGRYGLGLDAGGCTAYPAMIGRNRVHYQLCPVRAQAR